MQKKVNFMTRKKEDNFMISDKLIDVNELYKCTDCGKTIILHYYPQAEAGFKGRNFRLRPSDSDKKPSGTVFLDKTKTFWLIQDKGGSDTKARNPITLVMENERLEYYEALKWIASKFASHLLPDGKETTSRIDIKKSETAYNEVQVGRRSGGKFTEEELKIISWSKPDAEGKMIPVLTSEILEKEFNLIPLDYIITKKNETGESYIITATPDNPIYYYDYKSFGKIYQPFGKIRFTYSGKKQGDFIFGSNKVMKLIDEGKNSNFPAVDKDANIDERIENLIICSGPSDAINVSTAGYHVCWLNSETQELSSYDYYIFTKIAKNIYLLYDLDSTGIASAYKTALKYLSIKIIWLPESLTKYKNSGKVCKDAKDFFKHYRTKKHPNPRKYFDSLVKTSKSLQFWMDKYDNKGAFLGYDMDNAQLYGFLFANGICKVESNTSIKGFNFCYVKDNIIKRIPEEQIVPFVNNFLIKYLYNNSEYYTKALENAIHRSNQVKLASLEKIPFGEFDTKSYGSDFDYLFFKNTALRITEKGVEKYQFSEVGKYVYDFKIIDHEFYVDKPPFEVNYNPKYQELKNRLYTLVPRTPQWEELKIKIDKWEEEEDKYELKIFTPEFSFLKFIYNTGRVHWYKEAKGYAITEQENKEQDLYFIAKVCALGYLLYRYKESGQAFFVYGMETEQGSVGTHHGGTGKSILFNSVEYVRNQKFIDGQRPDIQKSEHLFSGIEKGITENVLLDDLSKEMDLHRFLNIVTGKMEIRALYKNTETLNFDESPKVSGTSNHSIRNFDSSLRRRTWFMAFCDYYHAENRMKGIDEKSPYKEFGKNLITDYSEKEMNQFYNFMVYCLHTYLKFRTKIQPPMEAIDKRNLQRELTDEFIWWGDDWFTEDRLNTKVDKDEAFEDWKKELPDHIAKSFKKKTFTNRLNLYCQYRGWIFNPAEMLKTKTEQERGEIREFRDGKNIYCFYIKTPEDVSAPAPPDIENNEPISDRAEGETPAKIEYTDKQEDKPPF